MDVFKQKHSSVWLGPEFLCSARINRRRTPSLGRNPKFSLVAAVVWLFWWLMDQMLWGRGQERTTLRKTAFLDLAAISVLSASCRQIGSPRRLFLDLDVPHFGHIRWGMLLLFGVSPWTPAPQVLNEFLLLSERRDHQVLGAGSFTSPSPSNQNRSDADESAWPAGDEARPPWDEAARGPPQRAAISTGPPGRFMTPSRADCTSGWVRDLLPHHWLPLSLFHSSQSSLYLALLQQHRASVKQ